MKKHALSLQEYIRLEAYLLSEKAGHPAGMDGIFWTQAEAIVQGRAAVFVAPGKSVKPKAKAARLVKKPAKQVVAARRQPGPKAVKTVKSKAKPAAKRAK